MPTSLLSFRRSARSDARVELIETICARYRRRWGDELAIDLGGWTIGQLTDLAEALDRPRPREHLRRSA